MFLKRSLLVIGATVFLLPFLLSSVRVAVADDGLITKIEKYPPQFGPYQKDTVTIACVQMAAVLGDTPATLRKMKGYLVQAAERGADIIVFPEWVLTTCDRDKNPDCTHKDVAEPLPGPSSLEIAKLTKEFGVYVVYGFLELDKSDPSKVYNTAAIVGPEGVIGGYRKIHPGFIEKVERGSNPVAFKTPWGPIGTGICLDNYGYPELARTYAMMGCRVLLNPTSLYKAGNMTEQTIKALCARAGENFLLIATANKVGLGRGGIVQSGQSTIIGHKGWSYVPIFYAGPASEDNEEILVAKVNLNDAATIRDLSYTFSEVPEWGQTTFLPEMWAGLWGTADEELASANERLEAASSELQKLRADNAELSRKSRSAIQIATLLTAAAAALLLAAVVFYRLASRKKKQ